MLSNLLKIISFLIVFQTALSADYFLNVGNSTYQCITEYYYDRPDMYYYRSDSPNTLRQTGNKVTIEGGYYFENGECRKKIHLEETGLTEEDFSYLMALLGVLTAFTFLFFGSYIATEVAKNGR